MLEVRAEAFQPTRRNTLEIRTQVLLSFGQAGLGKIRCLVKSGESRSVAFVGQGALDPEAHKLNPEPRSPYPKSETFRPVRA